MTEPTICRGCGGPGVDGWCDACLEAECAYHDKTDDPDTEPARRYTGPFEPEWTTEQWKDARVN